MLVFLYNFFFLIIFFFFFLIGVNKRCASDPRFGERPAIYITFLIHSQTNVKSLLIQYR